MNLTYTSPTLTFIGDSDEVILGIYSPGSDLDGTLVISDFEFMTDSQTDAL